MCKRPAIFHHDLPWHLCVASWFFFSFDPNSSVSSAVSSTHSSMHLENWNYCFMSEMIAMQLGFPSVQCSALVWWQTCSMKSAYYSHGRRAKVEPPCVQFCCRILLFEDLCRRLQNLNIAASWSYGLPLIKNECPEVPNLPICTETSLQLALNLRCPLNEKPLLCLLVVQSFTA